MEQWNEKGQFGPKGRKSGKDLQTKKNWTARRSGADRESQPVVCGFVIGKRRTWVGRGSPRNRKVWRGNDGDPYAGKRGKKTCYK